MIPVRAQRWIFGGCALLVMFGLFLSSNSTGRDLEGRLPGPTGNVLHLLAYGILSVLILRALVPMKGFLQSSAWPGLSTPEGRWTLCLSGVRGFLDEVHQHFVPGRSCSLFDFVMDLLGAWLIFLFPVAGAMARPKGWGAFLLVVILAMGLGFWGHFAPPGPDRWLDQLLDRLD